MPSRNVLTSLMLLTSSLNACVPMANAPIKSAEQKNIKPVSVPLASASLIDAGSVVRGKAYGFPAMDAVKIDVEVTGLPAGSYAMHLHGVGKCDAPDFKTAEAHLNPTGKMHGRDNPMGAHIGDLPNLVASGDGSVKMSFAVAGLFIDGDKGLFDSDGTSFIIHAKPDDFRTDPSGNSGARIICGVFGRLNY